MGFHRASAGAFRAPAAVLASRAEEVLRHLEGIQAGSVTFAEGERRVRVRGACLSVRCVEGEGIVVRAPLQAAREFAGGGPVGEHMEDIIADRYEWEDAEDRTYECGQGGEGGLMYQIEFVSSGPGPDRKHMVYRCSTVAELACFLDEFLGTYIWDSICQGRARRRGRRVVQVMGLHASRPRGGAAPPLVELEGRLRLVLDHLQRAKPGSVELGGLVHRVHFRHQGTTAELTVQSLEGCGIVVRSPMGAGLTSGRLAPVVEELFRGGPAERSVLGFLADEHEARVIEFSQSDSGENRMYRADFVSEGPGAPNKHLRYTCWTVAELACFLDHLLGTCVWDSISY